MMLHEETAGLLVSLFRGTAKKMRLKSAHSTADTLEVCADNIEGGNDALRSPGEPLGMQGARAGRAWCKSARCRLQGVRQDAAQPLGGVVMGKNPKVTPALLFEWVACYSEEEIFTLYDGRESVTLLEVLQSDIPDRDKVWVASRALDDRDARLFACWCAEQVLGDDCDLRSRAAVNTARRYAYGNATEHELATASAAASAAARAAAWKAAWNAAEAAAWEAAEAAAWSAAWDAARSAARKAAWKAAMGAAVERLIRHVTGKEPLV